MRLAISSAIFAFGLAGASLADQVFNDDVVVISDLLCVGAGCIDGEPNLMDGRDGIKLRANTASILFDDIDASEIDWRLDANRQVPGQGSGFFLRNLTMEQTPLTIEGGPNDNALFVDGNSDIGLGTSVPARSIHIKRGDTPQLRFEQDGRYGFTPQVWDIAANDAQFFLHDFTNRHFPFRIRTGAPHDAIYVAEDGDIGLGTSDPLGQLHLLGLGQQVANFESENGAPVQIRLRSNSQNRRIMAFDGSNNLRSQILFYNSQVRLAGPTDSPSDVYLIAGPAGIITKGPTCGLPIPCDAVFDPEEFTVPSIEEHAAYMWENQHLKAVGPTSADAPFNMTQKAGGMLHELEIAHIYIEELNGLVSTQQEQIAVLEAQVAEIATLKSMLEELAAQSE